MLHRVDLFCMLVLLCVCDEKLYVDSTLCGEAKHPQAQFCDADFVIAGEVVGGAKQSKEEITTRLKWKKKWGMELPKILNVSVLNVYKSSHQQLVNNKTEFVNITMQDVWQNAFNIGELYVISGKIQGGKLVVSPCSWRQRWANLTYIQKWGVHKHYINSCACQIRPCYNGECNLARAGCKWYISNQYDAFEGKDCKSRYGLCLYEAGNEQCDWFEPPVASNCNLQQYPDP